MPRHALCALGLCRLRSAALLHSTVQTAAAAGASCYRSCCGFRRFTSLHEARSASKWESTARLLRRRPAFLRAFLAACMWALSDCSR